jgi:hypothetical protein
MINKGFLNTNTVITHQLTRTARTGEEKWRHVLWGSVGMGQREMSLVLGAFELLDFTMLQAILAWHAV